MPASYHSFELNSMIREVVKSQSYKALTDNTTVEFEPQEEELIIRSCESRIKIVLFNLL